MMKSKVIIFCIFSLFVILFLTNISAQLNSTQIDEGYSCLQNKTEDCPTSTDDSIFTLLALKTCKQKVLDASTNGDCWPAGSCDVKRTAQALLALRESGSDTSKPKTWLLSHTQTPRDLEWFLQIETPGAATCNIMYGVNGVENTYTISINESKQINSPASVGSCLSLAQDNYWLKISSLYTCQNQPYEISCTDEFKTSTLFKEQTSSTIYVGKEPLSESAGRWVSQEINSSCFGEGTSCSYEGSLWAAYVLNLMNEDITPFIPYLVTMADDSINSRYLPEAFLYTLMGDSYLNSFLLRQKSNKYWDASGDRYYDTAVALLALSEDSERTEKTNSLKWLADEQGTNGCWQDNIKKTAFLLYAISPREGGDDGEPPSPACETSATGGYCLSSFDCTEVDGTVLDYTCTSGFVCCSRDRDLPTCTAQDGIICEADEECRGGITVQSSDTSGYMTCCFGGTCSEVITPPGNNGTNPPSENECETHFGQCKTYTCGEDETENIDYSCDFSSQVCCISNEQSPSNYLWVWILVILIILTIIGIFFRDKLRRLLIYVKSFFKPSGPSSGMHHPPYFPIPLRAAPRRVITHSVPPHHPAPVRKHSGELDEVLKKLKEMSK